MPTYIKVREKMKKTDISIFTNEAKVLSVLYYENLTRMEIAKATGLSYSGVNFLVLKLENLGLVKRVGMKKVKSGPIEDVYGITEKGIEALKKTLSEESLYLDILLDLKEITSVPITG